MPNDRRVLVDRFADAEDQIDRIPLRQGGTPMLAGRVYDGGKMPTDPKKLPAWFLVHPVEFDGTEKEGGKVTFATDTLNTVPVLVLRNPPSVDDILVAEYVGSKWVSEGKDKSTPPIPPCRWICGPYAQAAVPTGEGADCHAALVAVAVAPDGSIAALNLLDPGACYTVAHPAVTIVANGAGSGATASATVGEVVSLSLSDPGGGYDPASPPAVTIAAPGTAGGSTATATATVNADGTLSVKLTGGGALYPVANPTVTIDAPPAGAKAKQAKATAAASPGQITTLTLTAKGSGYADNTPPASLKLTVSGGTISFTATLSGPGSPATGGIIQGTAPPGTLPYCVLGGSQKVTFSPTCGGPITATVDIAAYGDGRLVVTPNVGVLTCPELFGAYKPNDGGPFGPIPLSCTARPFGQSITVETIAGPAVSPGWHLLAGGNTCPLFPFFTAGCDPVSITFSLSEP